MLNEYYGKQKKQTAIKWLSDKIIEILGDKCNELTIEQTLKNHHAFKQALEMEKQQIIDAFVEGCEDTYGIDEPNEDYPDAESAKDYYSKIYNAQQ